jgi:hypothetical protein
MNKIEVNLLKPSRDLLDKLLTSLLDYLLFSRSQIPFHFELFKRFIENKTSGSEERKLDWKTEKQLKLASEVLEKIHSLKEVRYLAGESRKFVRNSREITKIHRFSSTFRRFRQPSPTTTRLPSSFSSATPSTPPKNLTTSPSLP